MTSSNNETRDTKQSIIRGLKGKCPHCGEGKLFSRYLIITDSCPNCSEDLHHHRSDDAPTWITLIILGHLILPLVLVVENGFHPSTLAHMLIWPPLAFGLCIFLLPRAKGAVVGLQWALRMHGFNNEPES